MRGGGRRASGGGVGGPLFVCECIFLCSLKDCIGISAHFFVCLYTSVLLLPFLVPCHLFIFKVEALKRENIFK